MTRVYNYDAEDREELIREVAKIMSDKDIKDTKQVPNKASDKVTDRTPTQCKHDSPKQVPGKACPICGAMVTAEEWKGDANTRKKNS